MTAIRTLHICLAACLLLAGAAGAQAPEAERAELGRRLAAAGDFNAVVGAMGEAEVERIVREAPGLGDAERARLRAIGRRTLEAGRERLVAAVGAIYAGHYSLEELRAITAFFESPAGRAYTRAAPATLPRIAEALGTVDLGGDIRAAFCRETGRLCPAPER